MIDVHAQVQAPVMWVVVQLPQAQAQVQAALQPVVVLEVLAVRRV